MKKLKNPIVFKKKKIKIKGKKIGVIQLVKYLDSFFSTPHIEFKINGAFARKGIMNQELAIYLDNFWLKPKLIATTHSYQSLAAEKLLLKNGFRHVCNHGKNLKVFALNVSDIKVKKEIQILKK